MASQKFPQKTLPSTTCAVCKTKIVRGKDYCHQATVLCEECYIDVRTARKRKTHWQYLASIQTEYLQPAKKK